MDSSQNNQSNGLLGESEKVRLQGEVPVAPPENFTPPNQATQPVEPSQPTEQANQDVPPGAEDQQAEDDYRRYLAQSSFQKEEVLFEWKAPSRPFKRQTRQFYSTVGMIALLIGLILFFAGQVIPVAVVFAVVFLAYVMYSIPPGIVVHKLTTYGIRVEDTLYYWEEMSQFWFTEKYGQPLLHVGIDRFPFRLTLLLGTVAKDKMEYLLDAMLPQEVPPLTAYEKAAKWLNDKIPIDLES